MDDVSNKVLFLFDVLFDLDIGLFNLIKKEYRNKDLLHIKLLDTIPMNELKYLCIHRQDPNPLSVIVNTDVVSEDDMDSLHAQFMYERYSDIVKYSIPTNVCKLLYRLANVDNNISTVYIACKDAEEVKQIRNILKNLPKETYNFVPYHDLISEIDTSKYDTIFIKSYYDILRLKDIEGKNIMVADCDFNKVQLGENKDESVLNPEVSLQISGKAEISIVELYDVTSVLDEYDDDEEDILYE